MTADQAAMVQRAVRSFAQVVAHDVNQDGPSAWRRHFSDGPSFFLAAEGRMAFPNSEAATAGIQDLTRTIKRIELKWGDDLRVDPLASDLAVLAASWREVIVNFTGSRNIGTDVGSFETFTGRGPVQPLLSVSPLAARVAERHGRHMGRSENPGC